MTTDEKAERVKQLRAEGYKFREIAEQVGISTTHAQELFHGTRKPKQKREAPKWLAEAVRLRDEEGLRPTAIFERLGGRERLDRGIDAVKHHLAKIPPGGKVEMAPPKPAEKDERHPDPLWERPLEPSPQLVAAWRTELTENERELVLRFNPHFRERLEAMNKARR